MLWFRRDLRLSDNPALAAAIARGGPLVPVFVHDEASEGRWLPGGAARWWLHHSLRAFEETLRERGSRLIVTRGDTLSELLRLVGETGADSVYWNRRYEPAARIAETAVATGLSAAGIETRSFNAALLFEPDEIRNKQGNPFQVFTPFWRHCAARGFPEPVKSGARAFAASRRWPAGLRVEDLGLLPAIPWDAGLRKRWTPGEAGARDRLRRFLRGTDAPVHRYDTERDLMGRDDGVSGLSAHLHWGEIGPRQVVAAVRSLGRRSGLDPASRGAAIFLHELGWREFAHHLLYHFEHTPERPLRGEFDDFAWADDRDGKRLRAWRRGRTGYPIVDAGMRQLWATGWMHNRARMIVASFLVKHLRLDWRRGAAWFWDTLVDADLANNTLGWQWSAGCGADAAPYFRIFAPVAQGRRFDPDGDYVRRWVPELAKVPSRFIHEPWAAPAEVLETAGVRLGRDYPYPIVEHSRARAEALAAFKAMREDAATTRDGV